MSSFLIGFGDDDNPSTSGCRFIKVPAHEQFHGKSLTEPRGVLLDGSNHANSIEATVIVSGAFDEVCEYNIPADTLPVHRVHHKRCVRTLVAEHGGAGACRIALAHYHSLLVAADSMVVDFTVSSGSLLAGIARASNGYLYFLFSQRVGFFGWKTHAIVLTGDSREQKMPLSPNTLFATPCP